MHRLHEQILPQLIANHTRILRGPHITAFLEDWFTARMGKRSEVPKSRSAA